MKKASRQLRSVLIASALVTGAGAAAAGVISAADAGASTTTASTTTPSTGTPTTNAPTMNAAAPGNPADLTHGPGETLLTGTDLASATAAAQAAEPGATIIRAETDSSGAAYEVHMQQSDGTYVTVKLDANFTVSAIESGFGTPPTSAPSGAPTSTPNGAPTTAPTTTN